MSVKATYNGEAYDPKTGDIYLRARYYNTHTGTITTEDTYLGRLMDPRSLNRYAYAHGNPVNYQDPSGHALGDNSSSRVDINELKNSSWVQSHQNTGGTTGYLAARIEDLPGGNALCGADNFDKEGALIFAKVLIIGASVAITIYSGGTTAPLLAAELEYYGLAAGVTALSIAKALLTFNEVSFVLKETSDIVEFQTGNNPIKNTVYGGDSELYKLAELLQGSAIVSAFVNALHVESLNNSASKDEYSGKEWKDYLSEKYGKENVQGSFVDDIKFKPTSGVELKPTPGKTTTVIGSFRTDTGEIIDETGNFKSLSYGERTGGFNILNINDELSKASGEKFFEEHNVGFLDEAIGRDDIFLLVTKPTQGSMYRWNDISNTYELTGFGKEIEYLKSKGYRFDENLMQMVR